MNGDHVRACRRARELVADLPWQGLPVAPLYARMAAEFQELVASGEYAAWVAGAGAGEGSRRTRAIRPLPPGPA